MDSMRPLKSPSRLTKLKKLTLKSIHNVIPFTRRKYIQARILQNSQLQINQLPVEIFIKIVSFAAGLPSMETPYPYVVFSWVCHYWRSAILGNVVFWKTVVLLGSHGIPSTLLDEFLRRSRNVPLDVIIAQKGVRLQDVYAFNIHRPSVSRRFKTLHLDVKVFWEHILLLDFLSHFPSLENIFCHLDTRSLPIDLCYIPPYIQPQLKAMQISIEHLGNLAIPGYFRQLRWLSLTYETNSVTLVSLLEALKNIPNLQCLHLFGSSSSQPNLERGIERPSLKPTTTVLHKLRVLISNCPILHLIDAPKLSYLDICVDYPPHSSVETNYGHLCGFDFSKLIYIRTEIIRERLVPCITGNPTYKWKDSRNVDWFSFDDYRYNSGLNRIFDDFPDTDASNHPDQFHLSFGSHMTRGLERSPIPRLIPTFTLYVKKAINLVEIILKRLDLSFLDPSDINCFSNGLKHATTVRYLTILSSNSLKDLCEILSDGNLVPHLEVFSYSASYDTADMDHLHIPSSLWNLVKERSSKTLLRPLEIKLKGFPLIQSQELRCLERLGFQKQGQIWESRFHFSVPTMSPPTDAYLGFPPTCNAKTFLQRLMMEGRSVESQNMDAIVYSR